jgi:hypothetical protein
MDMSPGDIARAFLIICIGLAILTPVVGITARIALQPIAEMLARLREGQSSNQAITMIERRLDLLEREVQSLNAVREDVSRLQEAQEFHLRLAGEKQGIESVPPAGATLSSADGSRLAEDPAARNASR